MILGIEAWKWAKVAGSEDGSSPSISSNLHYASSADENVEVLSGKTVKEISSEANSDTCIAKI